MCQVTLDKYDVADVVAEQIENLAQLKTQMLGVHSDIFAEESKKIAYTIWEQGPEGIEPGLTHAFLTGLQLGQKYPTAVYPGKASDVSFDDINDFMYDEEEETELTFQSVRNS
jgi:hypothetical protein